MNTRMKHVVEYIKSHRLMQLATSTKNPWICTVFYAIDEKLNIYFISNPKRQHCLDIRKNKNVACAITDSNQSVVSKKIGVQIQGVASQINSDKGMKHAFDIWNKANPGFEKVINIENVRNGIISDRPFVITPKKIKFFNERLYGPDAVRTFRLR